MSIAAVYNEEMEITVLLFASVAERAGTRRFTLELDGQATVASARDAILLRYPALEAFVPTLMYALDEEYVREHDVVAPGSTLALIPPVSGG